MKKEALKNLLSAMTIQEKIGQLTQLGGEFFQTDNQEITGPIYAENKMSEEEVYTLGSVLGVYGVKNIRKIQSDYLKKSRMKIPLLFMADVIHGARTIFPIPLGLATSFNPNLAQKTAEIAAKEATAAGLHVTFAPMVDLSRDPRWGRVMEGTGEDTFLNGIFAEYFVRGFQGDFDKEHLAACVKHFAAYGAVEAGREYNVVDLPENKLRELYLPAYKAAIDAGVALVMTSFNTVNGIPATGNEWLMKEVLRDEWGFDGVVITDYGALMEQVIWGTAKDEEEAAQKALSATVDIEMMTTAYLQTLEKLVSTDKKLSELLDEAVRRVLELKNRLGLFEDPYRGATLEREKSQVFTEENKQVAYEAAVESIVLLKNDKKSLPLKKTDKVSFLGSLLDSTDLLGSWSWKGDVTETESVLSVLTEKDRCPTKEADKLVIFVGEKSAQTGESKSYTTISLAQEAIDLVCQYADGKREIILVVFAGRPLDLSAIADRVDSILYAYFPGTMGARAIVDLLYGKQNPSAKLTMSLPRSSGQIPIYYNQYMTGRPTLTENEEYVSRYQDCLTTPLYPFGHGLSYSDFEYFDSSVSANENKIKVDISVKNRSAVAGKTTVLIFVRDLVATTARPLKELKAFEKIELNSGEAKRLHFEIDSEQLKFYNFTNECVFEQGQFEVFIAKSSEDIIESKIVKL
ncbi:MAG: glycoside hydrolase family 3 C-terminal domain-containing protein [Streptococcaceae bacterium]|nr:glycoside hydrolase family 3 C-terminal domain-containing protein [Streptococcaceae bacterium]